MLPYNSPQALAFGKRDRCARDIVTRWPPAATILLCERYAGWCARAAASPSARPRAILVAARLLLKRSSAA